jgi:formylglycine-generating enzyme required for sulfatase activity
MACGEVDGGLGNSSNSGGPSRPSSSSNNAATSSSSVIDIGIDWEDPPAESFVHGTAEKIELSPFVISLDLISQGQYKAVMGVNPSRGEKKDNLPVEGVKWFDAVEFCQKLSLLMGLEKNAIRLPTEAQWEYVAYGGLTINRIREYWEWTSDCFGCDFPCEWIDPSDPSDFCPNYIGRVRKGLSGTFDARFSTDPYSDNISGAPISFRVVRIGRGF